MDMESELGIVAKTLIQTKVVQALQETPDYIETLVRAAMSQEVNQYGSPPTGYGNTKMPWLEWKCGDVLRQIATQYIHEIVSQNEPEIREAVKKAMSSEDIVSAFAKAVIDNTQSVGWSVEVNIKRGE